MIARCPHCDTAFRIVADQLRVRDGRVRCGVCHQVFDGRAALELATREAAAAVPPWDAPVAAPTRTEAAAPENATASFDVSEPTITIGRAEPRFGDAAAGAPGFVATRGAAPGSGPTPRRAEPVLRPAAGRVDTAEQRPPGVPRLSGLSGRSEPVSPRPAPRPAPLHRRADNAAETPLSPEAPSPRQFVASRPDAPLPPVLAANGQNGVMRLLWSLGFWIALLALLAQAIWWWRNPLATYFPPLRTPLEAVCQALGCEVGYLRAPHRLAIVSSSVQPDVLGATDDVQHLRLQAVLRNRAEHAQPWPTLEIILTDHGDAMVARRAVPPAEYLPPALQRQPFGAGAQQDVQLALAARGTPVSGYRLNLFFP
ncbi:MAG: zinc-ribbon domain-containing protein [Pigmentiphaga sp.]|nr:zinc-ribbon domain-containing protein [Pigmentiphaga sp.]